MGMFGREPALHHVVHALKSRNRTKVIRVTNCMEFSFCQTVQTIMDHKWLLSRGLLGISYRLAHHDDLVFTQFQNISQLGTVYTVAYDRA